MRFGPRASSENVSAEAGGDNNKKQAACFQRNV